MAEVFWQAGYYNYHTFFYLQHCQIFKFKSKASQEEKIEKIDRLLLSILAIPYLPVEAQQSNDNVQKIISLLVATTAHIPNREELIKIVTQLNLIDLASGIVRRLFNLVEGGDHMLNLNVFTQQVTLVLAELGKDSKFAVDYLPLIE